jgi:glycosyltransferase involved in cell wall biosynthesis
MKKLNIAIPTIGGKNWHGGINYVKNLIHAIRTLPPKKQPKLYLQLSSVDPAFLKLFSDIFPFIDGFVSCELKIEAGPLLIREFNTYSEFFDFIDFLFPVTYDHLIPDFPAASWIPDFQHLYLPQFFTEKEINRRDQAFASVSSQAFHVVLSSQDAAKDFYKVFPNYKKKVSVLNFHTYVNWEELVKYSVEDTRAKYGLTEDYILCPNQFWAHKNHTALIKALTVLKQNGKTIPLVCTGTIYDWRNKNYFNEFQAFIKNSGLSEQIKVLGLIPYEDLLQVMRGARFIVQPSLFEGWSTVVEDSRCLGIPVLLSDLEVHQEQAYPQSLFFDRNSYRDLAANIELLWFLSDTTSSAARELKAQTANIQNMKEYGKHFIKIAQEVHEKYQAQKSGMQFPSIQPPVESSSRIPSFSEKVTPTVPIATSLAPKEFEKQKIAVRSWFQLGFKPLSFNVKQEIEVLKPEFPDVKFIEIHRTGKKLTGKNLVFLSDILDYFRKSNHEVFGIANSDIILSIPPQIIPAILRKAKKSVLYSHRLNLESLKSFKCEKYTKGYDLFFLNPKVLTLLPDSGDLCLGAPWWDYWILLHPLLKQYSIRRINDDISFHLSHEVAWNFELFHHFGDFCFQGLPDLVKQQIPEEIISGINHKELDSIRFLARLSLILISQNAEILNFTEIFKLKNYQKVEKLLQTKPTVAIEHIRQILLQEPHNIIAHTILNHYKLAVSLSSLEPVFPSSQNFLSVPPSTDIPILVFQMGNVGSNSIWRTLKQSGFINTYQMHVFRRDPQELINQFGPSFEKKYIRNAIMVNRMLQEYRIQHPPAPDKKWKIITIMRDPIGGMVSEFFERLKDYFPHVDDNLEQMTAEFLVNYFKKEIDPMEIPVKWFENMFQGVLDINFFDQPFDKSKGYSIFDTPLFDVLAIKTEKFSDCNQEAMQQFLGMENFQFKNYNVAENKYYSQYKNDFQALLKYPQPQLDEIYSHRIVTHFYTPEEIMEFKNSWRDKDFDKLNKQEEFFKEGEIEKVINAIKKSLKSSLMNKDRSCEERTTKIC